MGGGQDDGELRRRLMDSLSRFGVAGSVTVELGYATLHGSGPTVTVDVGALLDDWRSLTEELRQRRVNEVARKLAGERRAVVGSSMPPREKSWSGVLSTLGICLAVVLAASGARILYRQWAAAHPSNDAPRPVIADYDAYERDRAERAARVCEATRSRVMRGATVGPSDVEGWVVELWALRAATKPSLVTDPALGPFVSLPSGQAQGRIVWQSAPSLTIQQGPDTRVAVVESNVPEAGPPLFRGVRLVMSGHYVVPYFNEPERLDYLRFARVLTDALGADYAALYARCASSTSHQLGSWFRGSTPGGSLASLLFFMGAFSEHPDLRPSVLAPAGAANIDFSFALQSLIGVTSPVKKTRVMTLVSADGGMISGTDSQISVITFPFRDGNRASRSSHVAARELGIGESN